MTTSDLHKVVLVQVERRVEDLETCFKELQHEVDDIDPECDHSCDCESYNLREMEEDIIRQGDTIDKLQQTIQIMLDNQADLLKRLEELEAGLED